MDTIIIADLEVFYNVGVTDAERAKPQKLLLTLELAHSFRNVAASDNLAETIDYDIVCQTLMRFGDGRHWLLIETLAVDIADMVLEEFRPKSVTLEIKKFAIPQTRYVAVRVRRPE
jgi:7,8-dihydroneopterin aldolase/epimerase/oxygenase